MEKEIGSIKFTETDNGLKIEISGDLKEKFDKCGCMPMMACCCGSATDCCPPKDKN